MDTTGDEGLRAIEHVVRAVLGQLGRRLHAREVRSGARLGHCDGPHLLAGDELGQPALLLLLGREHLDVGEAEQHVHARTAEGDSRARGLLGHDRFVLEGVETGTAVFLGHLDAEDSELGELVVELARHEASGVPLLEVWGDLGLDEGPDGLAEGLVVVVKDCALHAKQPTRE